MNDLEHYQAAEECLRKAEQAGPGEYRMYLTRRAGVHAQLAAVAQTVRAGAHPTNYWWSPPKMVDGWRGVLIGEAPQ
jgi:hypothetical protein